MANAKLYNLARMTTATTGTGTITLGSAVSGFLSFASAGVQNGDTVTYGIKDGANSEIGRGVYTSSGTTLTRSVLKSTNSDAAISLSGTAEVFITAAAQDFGGAGGPLREVLTANRTYYVRTDGSDTNNGLANTSGGAFATIQKAWDTIVTLDLSGFAATIKLGNTGTYTSGLNATVAPIGGNVVIEGDTTTPSNTLINTTSANCIAVATLAKVTVQYLKMQTTTVGYCLEASGGGAKIFVGAGIEFGAAAARYHMRAIAGGYINCFNNYTISGGAVGHMSAILGGVFERFVAVTLTGTLNFSTNFAQADSCGIISDFGASYTGGTITGKRYTASLNGAINTYGGGANVYPGDSAGTTGTGGQYA